MAQATSCQIQMANYVAGLQTSTPARKFTTAWKAMLLANPASRLADVVSNTVMAGMETAKSPVAAAIDRLASRRTGIRTRMFSMDDVGRASWEAVRKAREDFGQAMRGVDFFQSNRALDTFQGEVQYKTPLLGAVINGVFRIVSAADRPFKRFAFEKSLREQARIMGTQAGFAGAELEDFIVRTLPVMPDENVLRAFHDTHVATFSDMSPAAALLTGAKRGLAEKGGQVGEVVGDLVFPFAKVPSNVAHRVIEYTPIGMALGYGNLRRAFRLATNGDMSEAAKLQQYAVDQMGRSSAGIGALMAGWWLAERDLISLGFPANDQGEQGRWEATSQMDYSIRVGNRWMSVKKLAPWGPLMVIGAYAQRADAGEGEESGNIVSGLLGGIVNTMADQPAFTGARQIEDIRRDPGKGVSTWVERTAASFIPPVISRWATVVDPVMRETRGGDGITSLLQGRMPDAMQARIPYASQSLPARHDVLGDAVPKEGNAFLNFFDPFNSRLDRSTQDAVRRELDRLDVGITRMRLAPGEDREVFYRRREAYGIMLRGVLADVVASDEYQGIAEARRWMAQNVPGVASDGVERRVREEQRAFLEAAIRATRLYFSAQRRKGEFTGEDRLPTPDERWWTQEDAAERALDDAYERVDEIYAEEPGMPDDGA